MENRLPRVAITQGDTNGVGYEIILKALEDPTMLELLTPIIYGAPKVAYQHCERLGLEANYTVIQSADEIIDGRINLLSISDEDMKVDFGKPSEASGEAGLKAIDRALDDYQQGVFDVLVTAPLANTPAFRFSGQSRYVEDHLDNDGTSLTMLVAEQLRIALATRNLPLMQVMEAINQEHIESIATALHNSLRRDFRLSNPRLAILSLNPKAGDHGLLGSEEQELLSPAIKQLSENGLNTFGPYATDLFFGGNDWQAFDGTLAMYYDQALTPFRALSYNEGCYYTAGLPLVHTAPITGVEFEQAGKGTADATSLRHAIFLAIDIWRNRQEFDEPLANPLKKLYKEKREDGDRSRFSIPKKKVSGPKEEKGTPQKEKKAAVPTEQAQ